MACVDWCDAYDFCQGVGKRLCGRIGGGPNAQAESTESSQSQWYNACSSGGVNDYPYGDDYQPTICNDFDYGTAHEGLRASPVQSFGECQPAVPYAGVYDLSGNVLEWEDSCEVDAALFCLVRGGSYWEAGQNLLCAAGVSVHLETYSEYVGFRCCSP